MNEISRIGLYLIMVAILLLLIVCAGFAFGHEANIIIIGGTELDQGDVLYVQFQGLAPNVTYNVSVRGQGGGAVALRNFTTDLGGNGELRENISREIYTIDFTYSVVLEDPANRTRILDSADFHVDYSDSRRHEDEMEAAGLNRANNEEQGNWITFFLALFVFYAGTKELKDWWRLNRPVGKKRKLGKFLEEVRLLRIWLRRPTVAFKWLFTRGRNERQKHEVKADYHDAELKLLRADRRDHEQVLAKIAEAETYHTAERERHLADAESAPKDVMF